MKKYFLGSLAIALFVFIACNHDDEPTSIYEYHVHIHAPDSLAKTLGDTLPIEVEFESHTGETIHHINVRIFNKTTLAEVYNLPVDPHLDDPSGAYTYTDQFVLSAANGLSEGDWILEGKVWGHEDGVEETYGRVEFHINP